MGKFSGYDFLDFGCGSGGSMRFCELAFGGKGLGLDINPHKVEQSRRAGFDALVQDVCELDPLTMGRVRYVVMSHFLEHMPTMGLARRCIESAARVAEEFVLIQQPYFDADGYLFERGLKLYWSDLRVHTNHMTMLDFHNAFAALPRELRSRTIIGRRFPIASSRSDEVHCLLSATDQGSWEESVHPPKATIDFGFPVFREVFALVLTGERELGEELRKYTIRKGAEIVFDSWSERGEGDRPAHR